MADEQKKHPRWALRHAPNMEPFGYRRLEGNAPGAKVQEKVVHHWRQSVKKEEASFRYCEGGRECEEFLMSGNPDFERTITSKLDMEYRKITKQGPGIVEILPDPNMRPQLRRAHPSRDSIIVFRPLLGPANWGNGLAKLCSSSHNQGPNTIGDTMHGDVHETPDNVPQDLHEVPVDVPQTLCINGDLHVMPSPNGGAVLVWMAFSKRPMMDDIYRHDIFPFMKT
ncbi:hypothetical protein BDV33DRAFT_211144 [Aspergillus novoparasiticus]|uniref:Uncharacterized protein n=1 Tax=Aspergillus novoparasiticus TaxID=986946 RepID=A0A5N6E4Z8_9EURO|nr:hypothetical protein BDV33DRAFT_211144 [Aspergillus novoparasiticus]